VWLFFTDSLDTNSEHPEGLESGCVIGVCGGPQRRGEFHNDVGKFTDPAEVYRPMPPGFAFPTSSKFALSDAANFMFQIAFEYRFSEPS